MLGTVEQRIQEMGEELFFKLFIYLYLLLFSVQLATVYGISKNTQNTVYNNLTIIKLTTHTHIILNLLF